MIRSVKGVRVVDETGRMLLVDGPADDLQGLVAEMPDWVITPEHTILLPDPRRQIGH